ncbi:unnamed protein product [Boreogadus saida]
MDGPQGASSTLSLPMSQGKPSLRRIKGRIHRSKSLDSMDLLDAGEQLKQGAPDFPYKMMVEILCATMVSGESKETLCFLRVEVIACVLWMWS